MNPERGSLSYSEVENANTNAISGLILGNPSEEQRKKLRIIGFGCVVIRGTKETETIGHGGCYDASSASPIDEQVPQSFGISAGGLAYGDPPIDSWSGGKYDQIVRTLGRDWPALAQTMIGTIRMRNLRWLCETAILDDVPGDFVETGVWRGGACIYMRGILEAYGDPSRRVFVADSFKGLPPPNASDFPADMGDIHHTHPQLTVSRSDVEENFRRYGLLDDRVIFLEGWFKDTLPAAPVSKIAVLRLDGDMYESTIQALDALYHKVSPRGFVIIDDYFLKPCSQAVNDFRNKHSVTSPIIPIDGWAVWWRLG